MTLSAPARLRLCVAGGMLMLPSASSVRQLVLSLVALSPLILAVYILAGFPSAPSPPVAHPSLAVLPPSCASWSVYPDDYYQGGSYVLLPHGRVSRRAPLRLGIS